MAKRKTTKPFMISKESPKAEDSQPMKKTLAFVVGVPRPVRIAEELAQLKAFGDKVYDQAAQIRRDWETSPEALLGESRILKMVVEANLNYFQQRLHFFQKRLERLGRSIRKSDLEEIQQLEVLCVHIADCLSPKTGLDFRDSEIP